MDLGLLSGIGARRIPNGAAATFDHPRPPGWCDQRDWTALKYAMRERGERMPSSNATEPRVDERRLAWRRSVRIEGLPLLGG
jgi:hypothetical protein